MAKDRSFRDSSLTLIQSNAQAINKDRARNMHICRYASGLVHWIGNGVPLPPEYESLAEHFCSDLNKELHHDGKWTVAWSRFSFAKARYTRLTFSFYDQDDDLHFNIHNEQDFLTVFTNIHELMEQCEDGWKTWRKTLEINDIRPKDTIKAALGEKSADPTAQPSSLFNLDS